MDRSQCREIMLGRALGTDFAHPPVAAQGGLQPLAFTPTNFESSNGNKSVFLWSALNSLTKQILVPVF